MKIKSITEGTHHIIETDDQYYPRYRRDGKDNWSNFMGIRDGWAPPNHKLKDLERLFQDYEKTQRGEETLTSKLEKYCINSEFYPLTLDKELHLCLWQEDNTRYSIAYFDKNNEGYSLSFVCDRPLNEPGLNWSHFQQLIREGQKIADARFDGEEDE